MTIWQWHLWYKHLCLQFCINWGFQTVPDVPNHYLNSTQQLFFRKGQWRKYFIHFTSFTETISPHIISYLQQTGVSYSGASLPFLRPAPISRWYQNWSKHGPVHTPFREAFDTNLSCVKQRQNLALNNYVDKITTSKSICKVQPDAIYKTPSYRHRDANIVLYIVSKIVTKWSRYIFIHYKMLCKF